jgi:hypothetical protein
MRKNRFRLMAGLAGTTLCLFAVSGYAQNTSTPGTSDPAATGSAAAPQGGTGSVSAPTGGTDATAQTAAPTTTGGTDVTTTGTDTRTTDATTTSTSTTSFPGGVLGILAVAVVILLILFALFRGRDKTVVRETSTASTTAVPGGRTATTTATTADDRMNVSSRAASGSTGTSPGGMGDPNARR